MSGVFACLKAPDFVFVLRFFPFFWVRHSSIQSTLLFRHSQVIIIPLEPEML